MTWRKDYRRLKERETQRDGERREIGETEKEEIGEERECMSVKERRLQKQEGTRDRERDLHRALGTKYDNPFHSSPLLASHRTTHKVSWAYLRGSTRAGKCRPETLAY